jgi:hypothetical protein
MKVLLVNHSQQRCGVYQYGKRMADILLTDNRYISKYIEADDQETFFKNVSEFNPDVIVYNWHNATLSWFTPKISYQVKAKQLILHHEDNIPYHLNSNAIIMTDMSENKVARIYGLQRPLFDFPLPEIKNNEILTVGSFGFGFENKGFEKICVKVCEEYDEAIINLHITAAFFGDRLGVMTQKISDQCKNSITKPNIQLNITNHFIPDKDLIDFLGNNDVNLFLYAYEDNRGLSSAIDYAAASGKPFGVSNSSMFRHVLEKFPELNANENSIESIMSFGSAPSNYFREEWSSTNLKNKFFNILEEIVK